MRIQLDITVFKVKCTMQKNVKIIKQNIDNLAVVETKRDASVPSAQFFLVGYLNP